MPERDKYGFYPGELEALMAEIWPPVEDDGGPYWVTYDPSPPRTPYHLRTDA